MIVEVLVLKGSKGEFSYLYSTLEAIVLAEFCPFDQIDFDICSWKLWFLLLDTSSPLANILVRAP